MSWTDVVANALGAVGQYMPQMERIQQQRKQTLLDQERQRIADEQLEFNQVDKAYAPGQPVDPTIVPKVLKYGLKGRLGTDENGQLIWADDMDTKIQKQQIKRESALTNDAENRFAISTKELAARKWIEEHQDEFMQMPVERKQLLWAQANLDGAPQMNLEEYKARQEAGQSYLAAQLRAGSTNALDPLERERLKAVAIQNLKDKWQAMETNGMMFFPKDDGTRKAGYEADLQKLMGGQQGPVSNAPQASARQPAPPGMVWVQSPNGNMFPNPVPESVAAEMVAKGGRIVR